MQPRIYRGLAIAAATRRDTAGAQKEIEAWLKLDPKNVPALMLGVAPGASRRGVGQLLMRYCADVARQNGKTRLTLSTSVKNSTAQAFYEAIGYKRLTDLELEDGSKLCSYELNLR